VNRFNDPGGQFSASFGQFHGFVRGVKLRPQSFYSMRRESELFCSPHKTPDILFCQFAIAPRNSEGLSRRISWPVYTYSNVSSREFDWEKELLLAGQKTHLRMKLRALRVVITL